MTEQLHFIFSFSCIGEGNGNPFQCSCLENPRDGGGWWAAVYGVAQSWTRLKQLSSSSSSSSSTVKQKRSWIYILAFENLEAKELIHTKLRNQYGQYLVINVILRRK